MTTPILEEKLREASCLGDIEAVKLLLAQDFNINSKNQLNGWTALHWACKRNNDPIIKLLLQHGADPTVVNEDGRKPIEYLAPHNTATFGKMSYTLAGSSTATLSEHTDLDGADSDHQIASTKFTPNYLRNPVLNGQVDVGSRYRPRHTDITALPTTNLPASNDGQYFDK